jgi:DNA-binding SARP family transcriptional activator/Flp pilus assembly protein TadD
VTELSPPSHPPYFLRTLGTLGLSGPSGELVLGAHGNHRRRLALLSVLAVSGKTGRSRDQLLALFWPEARQPRARHSLDQLLYALRTTLTEDVFAGVSPVRLNSDVVGSDLESFTRALDRGDDSGAVTEYRGRFLDGFYLDDAPEFERWVEAERSHLVERYAGALERMAHAAEAVGDYRAAVRSWRVLIDAEPLSTRYAVGLVRALMHAGENAAALQSAEQHEVLVARELGTTVGAEITELVTALRGASKRRPVAASSPAVLRLPPPSAVIKENVDTHRDSEPAPTGLQVPSAISWRGFAYLAGAFLALAGVTAGLRMSLSSGGRATSVSAARALARVRSGPSPNVAAYELYVHGNDASLYRSDSGARVALGYFQRAIALDPRYAGAYAGVAQMQVRLATVKDTTISVHERLRLAAEAATTAVALDDSSADAHAALSVVRKNNYDFPGAEVELMRAVSLDPESARYHEWLVQLYALMDRPAAALVQAHRALELDPLSAPANAELAHAMLAGRRCDEALAQLAPLRSLQPPLLRAAEFAAQGYACKGLWGDGIAAIQGIVRTSGPRGEALLGYLLARAGRTVQARRILSAFLERQQRRGDVAGEIAMVYAGLGDTERTVTWLEDAREQRTLILDQLPLIFEQLRPDPRIELIRHRLGFASR